MPFAPFHDLYPDVAERETRTLTVPDGNPTLPTADYGFVDMYCDEPDCDCRRVFFSVVSSKTRKIEAVIAWGWESVAFYDRWLGGLDRNMAKEMQGPVLNLASPQSKIAPALLEFTRRVLLTDPDYVERIKRHYALFREKIDGGRVKPGQLAKGPRRKKGKTS